MWVKNVITLIMNIIVRIVEDKFKIVLEKPENDMKGISVFSY